MTVNRYFTFVNFFTVVSSFLNFVVILRCDYFNVEYRRYLRIFYCLNINILKSNRRWFYDGEFDSAPFWNLCSIHGLLEQNKTFCRWCTAFLWRKTRKYIKFLEHVSFKILFQQLIISITQPSINYIKFSSEQQSMVATFIMGSVYSDMNNL